MTGENPPPNSSAAPFWLAGRPATGSAAFDVTSPWDGATVGRVRRPGRGAGGAAVAAAAGGAGGALRDARAHTGRGARPRLQAARGARGGGRPADHRGERQAAQMGARRGRPRCVRLPLGRRGGPPLQRGEAQRLDTDPGGVGRLALDPALPRGPVLGIAPFNFPLNLVAHKVAPALAVGRADRPQARARHPALRAAARRAARRDRACLAGAWSVLPVPNDRMPALVADPRLPVVSFTGSDTVGHAIARRGTAQARHPGARRERRGRGARRLVVRADLDCAASRIATFANYQGGQSCISVQRVVADAAVYDAPGRTRRGQGPRAGHRRPRGRGDRRRPAGEPRPRPRGSRGGWTTPWPRARAADRRHARRRELRPDGARRRCQATPYWPPRRHSGPCCHCTG